MARKVGFALAAIAICAIGIAILFMTTRLDGFVADTLESYGRATMGTDVSVGGVDIALTQSRGKVGNLTIDNPQGFDTDYFLHVEDVAVTLDLGSLGGTVPIVREVVVDGAHLNAEQRGDATNITQIQRYMTRPDAAAPPDPRDEGSD
jgi:hypothetical protein